MPAEDWAVWDLPRDYSPLRAMPHLSRLTLNIVEELESNIQQLYSLTQARSGPLAGGRGGIDVVRRFRRAC